MTIGKVLIAIGAVLFVIFIIKSIDRREQVYDVFDENCAPTGMYIKHEGIREVYECSEPPEDCDPPEELDRFKAILWCKEQEDLKNVEG